MISRCGFPLGELTCNRELGHLGPHYSGSVAPLPERLCQRYCNALIAGGELGPRCPLCDDSERWVAFWTRVLAGALTPEAQQRAELYK